MCRSIRTLYNFEPPATEEDVRAASLQFVRKLSGYNKPSRTNEEAFSRAVEEVAAAARTLLASLSTAPPVPAAIALSAAAGPGRTRTHAVHERRVVEPHQHARLTVWRLKGVGPDTHGAVKPRKIANR